MSFEGLQLGRYRLVRLLGSGGMGEVYLAEDPRIEQQVAIKVIHAEFGSHLNDATNSEALRLFEREARAIAKLDHPNILSLPDFGEQSIRDITLTYIVMPYRKEGSLASWLVRRGNTNTAHVLALVDVASIINQAADALQHAHEHDIVHQDVKPQNFLIRERRGFPDRPDLLLADFGIAKFTTATATVSQSIRGTPAYMAPEQWDGQPVPATDQYALAIMAYQLLTGRLPFEGGQGQVMRQHFMTPPTPPSQLSLRIPPALDAVILRALEKKPEDRFASVADFAHAFQDALQQTHTEAQTANTRRGTDRTDHGKMEAVSLSTEDTQTATELSPLHTSEPPVHNVPMPIVPSPPHVGETQKVVTGTMPLIDEQASRRMKRRPTVSRGKVTLFASLILLVLLGSLGLLYTTVKSQSGGNTGNATATATAHANASGTGTAEAATNTVVAQASATFAAHAATSTAIAIGHANATATARANANANATATAQAYANATATAASSQANAYLPYTGSLAWSDLLQANNSGHPWAENSSCFFRNGGYHAQQPQNIYGPCFTQNTTVSNFIFQVQMTVLQGDCGGIVFRASSASANYFFRVCPTVTGYYDLYLLGGSSSALTHGVSPAMHTGLNQTNLLGVVASGSTIVLYMNGQKIDTVNNTSYSQGQLALFADGGNHPTTEVAFANAELWTM